MPKADTNATPNRAHRPAKKKERSPAQPKSFAVQSIELLPFVKTKPGRGKGRDWWVTPDVSEDLGQLVGEGFALEWLRHTRRYEADGSSFFLVGVIQDMVKKGHWTSIEYDFVSTLALALNGLVRT